MRTFVKRNSETLYYYYYYYYYYLERHLTAERHWHKIKISKKDLRVYVQFLMD